MLYLLYSIEYIPTAFPQWTYGLITSRCMHAVGSYFIDGVRRVFFLESIYTPFPRRVPRVERDIMITIMPAGDNAASPVTEFGTQISLCNS